MDVANIKLALKGILIPIGVMGIVGAAYWWNVFASFNAITQDAIFQTQTQSAVSSSLLIVANANVTEHQRDQDLHNLINRFRENGAYKIVVLYPYETIGELILGQLASYKNLILVVPKSRYIEFERLFAVRQVNAEFQLVVFEVDRPEFGVVRTFSTHTKVETEIVPNLYHLFSDKAYGQAYINYFIKANNIAIVDADQVLNGEVISGLSRDKMVVITPGQSSQLSFTSTSYQTGDALTLTTFLGTVAQTLLTHQVLTEFPRTVVVTGLIILGVVCFLVFQWFSVTLSLWVAGGLSLLLALVAWTCQTQLLMLFPLTEFLVLKWALFIFITRKKSAVEQKQINKLLLSSSAHLQQRMIPTQFSGGDEHWSQIINMVNQVLDLNRAIFLEPILHSNKLQEVKALNCSFSDIDERRRDMRRAPYVDAIKSHEPIKSSRKFFKRADPDEDQYVVCLNFTGSVMGFWMFGVTRERASEIPGFINIVKNFSAYLSELLYQHQQWEIHQLLFKPQIMRFLRFESGTELINSVGGTLQLLNRRMASLEEIFNGLASATILYDLFGRVIQINNKMETLLAGLEVKPFDYTALDLMTALTDLSHEAARKVIRIAVIEKRASELSFVNKNTEQVYTLLLKPLIQKQPESNQQVTPFNLYGLLLEINENTVKSSFGQMQNEIYMHLFFQLGRHLNHADTVLKNNKNVTQAQLKLTQSFSQMNTIIGKTKRYLIGDSNFNQAEIFPININTPLQVALERVNVSVIEKSISIDNKQDNDHALVLAKPFVLVDLLEQILQLLIEDATEGSQLLIRFSESNDALQLQFANQGFGIPNERLQDYLNQAGFADSTTFQSLCVAIEKAELFNAMISGESDVGVGMKFTIQLTVF